MGLPTRWWHPGRDAGLAAWPSRQCRVVDAGGGGKRQVRVSDRAFWRSWPACRSSGHLSAAWLSNPTRVGHGNYSVYHRPDIYFLLLGIVPVPVRLPCRAPQPYTATEDSAPCARIRRRLIFYLFFRISPNFALMTRKVADRVRSETEAMCGISNGARDNGRMMAMINVATIDSSPIFQIGLRDALQETGDIIVVAQGATGSDACAIASRHRVDVMLLGLPMDKSTPGLLSAIREKSPAIRLALLTSASGRDAPNAAVPAGVWEYFPKEIEARARNGAVLELHRGRSRARFDMPVRPPLSRGEVARPVTGLGGAASGESLSYREAQILTLVCRGMTNAEIGGELRLASQTVKNYMSVIIEKFQVRNRSGAIMKFMAGQGIARAGSAAMP